VPGEQVMMQMASPKLVRAIDTPAEIASLLRAMGGLTPGELAPLPIEIVSTGLPDIILPVRDVSVLQALKPDMPALSAFSEELGVVGVHAFAKPSESGLYTAHVRNFAPRYAIPEESATGTANAAMTYYLFRQGLIGDGARCAFLQGEAMGRPSTVLSTLDIPGGSSDGQPTNHVSDKPDAESSAQPDIRVGGPVAILSCGILAPWND